MKLKNRNVFLPLVVILVALGMQSYTHTEDSDNIKEEITMPDNVKAVIDNKCFGCHNVDAKSDKAKDKLLLDKLGELSKAKLISTMGDISEVAEEGAMPPEKFLEQKPEMKLTAEEQQILADWAKQTSEALLN